MLSKVFPYSLPSVGPGAYPGVQAVSPQVTWSESRHIPSSSLPLLSARPAFYLRSFHQMALPVNGSTHLIPAYYSFYRPRKDERLSWPSWRTYSGWLTHISGYPSSAGRAQDRESSYWTYVAVLRVQRTPSNSSVLMLRCKFIREAVASWCRRNMLWITWAILSQNFMPSVIWYQFV